MSVQSVTTAKSFADLYAAEKARLPGAALPWLARLRDQAMQRVSDAGLPTARLEDWRYTPALSKRIENLSLAEETGAGDTGASLVSSDRAVRLSLRDGRVSGDIGTAPGLSIRSLQTMLAEAPEEAEATLGTDGEDSTVFAALNLALMQDALFVTASPGRPEPTLELDHRTSGALSNPRLHLTVRSGTRMLLVERFRGGSGFSNRRVLVTLEAGASLAHYLEFEEGAEATQLGETAVEVRRDATYRCYLHYGGTGLARQAVKVELQERGASAVLNGAYLLAGRAHGDLTSHIRHLAPDTASSSIFKGVLDDRARQVFRGKITVEAKASRADGRMTNKTLLLSDQAEIDSKPELMIFHDDVQCAHGATSGKIDEQALFYLRSRGLPLPQARRLLLRSFLEETLDGLSDGLERSLAESRLDRRLEEIAR